KGTTGNQHKTTSYDNSNYYDQVSSNIHNSLGTQAAALGDTAKNTEQVLHNDALSTPTKVTAVALNVAEAGMQAMGALGAVDDALESALLPVLGALGMQGLACLPISKQLDPVMGIDIHFVTIPPSPAPIPMPHPYIGMLFRAKDFASAAIASVIPAPPTPPAVENPHAPNEQEQQALNTNKAANLGHMAASMVIGMLGATVKIGGYQPRAVAGTPTKSIPHFPMGTGFHPAFTMVDKNIGHAFMGSLFTLADQDPISGGPAHLHLNCNDVGIVSPHDLRPSKNTETDKDAKINLYLPTGVINPIPPARSILTNPVPAPMNPVSAIKQLFKASLGRFYKKKAKGLADKLHTKVHQKIKTGKLRKMLHKAICTVTGHPVDVATGNFFTDEEDFYLPGQIPISWERTYYSNSDYQGPLGYGWHHLYDIALHIDQSRGILSLRMNDGRPIAFPIPSIAMPQYNRQERLEAQVTAEGRYRIWNEKEGVFYYFTENSYADLHLIETIANKNGFGIQFTYNTQGHLTRIIDSAHRKLEVVNDAEGRILKIYAPHPEKYESTFVIAAYTYDEEGNLICQTNAEGDAMHFAYKNHLMVQETWRNGLCWFFKYDGNTTGARCIHTWGDGDIYNHKLQFYEGLTKVENSLGHLKAYYHKNGLVYKRIDPNDAEHTWCYNAYNELLSETDPEGASFLYDYDARGNQLQETAPNSATTLLEYEDFDHLYLPTQVTDVLGGVWKRTYTSEGNLQKTSNPNGAITQLDWKDGLLSQITDALGNTTLLKYDKHYNLTQVISPTGATTSFVYDDLGRNTQITNAKGAQQLLTYDLLGRVIGVHDFDGNCIQLSYDGIDNLLEYKDKDQTVKYKYAGMWKLTSRSDARGRTDYFYNTEEQLTQLVNENNISYLFTLNEVGDVIKEQGFDRGITHYKRDKAGKILQKNDPAGRTSLYTYTKDGQVCEITYHDGTTVSYDYNAAGQLVEAINSDATVRLERNILGQITKETVNGVHITHQYNHIGQRVGLQSSLGANMQFEFDALGQLTKQQANGWQSEFEYDSLGLEINRKLLGGISQQSSYDNIGRLTGQQVTGGGNRKHHRQYRWGVNDRLQSIIDSATGTTEFQYSKTGHLTYAKFGNGTVQHRTADKVGNLFDSPNKKDRTYNYRNRLEKKGNWHYKYDDVGNLIEKYKKKKGLFESKTQHWKYKWNDAGMLQEVIRPDKEKVSFKYDPLGRRISKVFKKTTTCWVWNGHVPLHEWKQYQQRHYTDEGIRADKIVKHHKITWIFDEGSFIPSGKIKDNKKFSILANHLGTPTQMYDEEGEQVWEQQLDTNGKPIYTKENGITCDIRFQGQEFDKDIELCYNRFRWYDDVDGRYISQDPIGLASGNPNFYTYVSDVNSHIDSLGLSSSPLGFKSFGQLKQFGQQIQGTLARAGFKDTGVFMQGSSVSGRSYSTGVPFDVGRVSDFDVAITNSDLLKKAQDFDLGKPGRNLSMPLKADDMRKLGFGDLADSLSERFGREVNFRIFDNEASVRSKGKSYKITCH
ncbi:DUF6531 domain-containing protein, partial [Tenacibaculum maritimum]|uniref:DUF6531 domain-containing protein n=2 Tax=Tenacibaculum maritimum TaxID=107401 RepID=UPI00132FF637